MDFLGNYICAFYPWCFFAIPFVAGILLGVMCHLDKTKIQNLGEDGIGGTIIASVIGCAIMPFWPILIFGPLSYFMTKFVLGRVSISFKKKD